MTVSAVEALLHRAREGIRGFQRGAATRYLTAWTAENASALVELLAEDATFSTPPQRAWFRGRDAIGEFLRKRVFVGDRWELQPASANGAPAFIVWRAGMPHAIHVLEHDGSSITGITCFLDADLVRRFQRQPNPRS